MTGAMRVAGGVHDQGWVSAPFNQDDHPARPYPRPE